ncbi:short chain dehydrogenase/reductase family oxidoreductase [Glycocaulis alkaliphilus]|uniref:Peroxisomal trans-2-enoyl-CoA reductase n=1 Tax=Glycocaulis alkaliphilus TaxID=1434191 RepID=A0A3T0E7B6_9PROT|nr:SDR family oxidoreductase [Glycocaulis alkaliphilus]AZU03164.1 short chain dehydrogenase/reductase family oxidoreductase [Glycocaulis alkaliphilus]GGB71475.1 citronellol catabolism dehydrogenase [Glycocaulis alkaliphilus]
MTAKGYDSVFREQLFAGKTIIVTGGGSGIGRCTAHELASLGAKVIITGRKAEKLQGVAAEIAEDGGVCHMAGFDIRDEDAVKAAVTEIVAEHGPVHGLVNNAGGQFPASLQDISKKGWDAVIATNLTGGFLMMRAVFEASMAEHGGTIVNMTADMWNGMPGMAHSGAARAGMANLTKTAAFEWAQYGVRVNAVAPGWVASSGMDTYGGAVRAMIPHLRQHLPAKRMGTEAEVSSAIVFLLSEGASFITGVTLAIDGGAPLGSAVFPLPDHEKSVAYNGFHRAVDPEVLRGGGS